MKQKILLVLALIVCALWLAAWLPLMLLVVVGLFAVVILCGGLQLLGDVMR